MMPNFQTDIPPPCGLTKEERPKLVKARLPASKEGRDHWTQPLAVADWHSYRNHGFNEGKCLLPHGGYNESKPKALFSPMTAHPLLLFTAKYFTSDEKYA